MKTRKLSGDSSESEPVWDEERMDIIGQNGPDGLVYEVLPYQDDFEAKPDNEIWMKKGTVKELIEVLSKANPDAIVTSGYPVNKVVFSDKEVELL